MKLSLDSGLKLKFFLNKLDKSLQLSTTQVWSHKTSLIMNHNSYLIKHYAIRVWSQIYLKTNASRVPKKKRLSILLQKDSIYSTLKKWYIVSNYASFSQLSNNLTTYTIFKKNADGWKTIILKNFVCGSFRTEMNVTLEMFQKDLNT